ncbi:MAG TPA: MMPL family transporter [Intrasporangiaceae bacterium]|nr:MMPL family transporter [Intrasporangiaceae bacterium]
MHRHVPRIPLSRATTRRGSWVALIVGLLVGLTLIGGLRGIETPPHATSLPTSAESARAAEAIAALPGGDVPALLVVATRADGTALSPTDLAGLTDLGAHLPAAPDTAASPAIPSEDGRAAMLSVPVVAVADFQGNREVVDQVRDVVRDHAPNLTGLDVQVTGGPAFGADVSASFDGADLRLLLATIAVVAVLLLITYRSPILWLIPLLIVGLADQVAAGVVALLAREFELSFDAGIVSVLVFGAGTNYALLLISRYREELRRESDHRRALTTALRGSRAPILASNLTVVLALGTLVLATIPSTRGLGIAAAAGLLIVLAFVLLVLPAALAVTGRGVFWPFIPRPGQAFDPQRSVFGTVARWVLRRPVPVLVTSVAALAVLAASLIGQPLGLQVSEQFRTQSESAQGLETLAEHFPAGAAQPLTIVTTMAHSSAMSAAVGELPDVADVTAADATPPADPSGAGHVVLHAVTTADPGTAAARDALTAVRDAAHAVDPDALVGGAQAEDLDARTGTVRDLRLVAPLILIVTALVLLALLRSLVAPVVLLAVNTLSSLSAIGAGTLIGTRLLGWPALDLAVPLLAFLFLVALGIDYTIFLMHRAATEARDHGTRTGLIRAVGATGAVITSAGVVLAGVFAALSVLPLVTLGQIGLIVGLGVIIDTFVVRTIMVPALVGIIGDRIWWPARVPRSPAQPVQ